MTHRKRPNDKAVKPRFQRFAIVYPMAVRQFREPTVSHVPACVDDGLLRGSIHGFSRHSRLRLREFLASKTLDGELFGVFGICFTVPWRSLSCGSAHCEYRAAWNRLKASFHVRFPHSAAVFRHELQVRRMPHCHMVMYLSADDCTACADVRQYLTEIFGRLWFKAIKYQLHGGDACGFSAHAVKVDLLLDSPAVFRYVSDHASKHKAAQLGYNGKQWGVFHGKLFRTVESCRLDFPDLTLRNVFFRQVAKCVRFRVKSPSSPFGSKLSRKNYTLGVSFLSSETTCRLYDSIVGTPERWDRFQLDYYDPILRASRVRGLCLIRSGGLCDNMPSWKERI